MELRFKVLTLNFGDRNQVVLECTVKIFPLFHIMSCIWEILLHPHN